MDGLKGLLVTWGAIGDGPEDDDEARVQHALMVWMATAMSVGGLIWGAIAAGLGMFWPAMVPLGYVFFTSLNLLAFWLTKRFDLARQVHLAISLLLPFLFQLSFGGFLNSGAAMLWAMFALAGGLTFSDARKMTPWVLVYVACTIGVGALDPLARQSFTLQLSPTQQIAFFVVNISFISSAVFLGAIHLLERVRRIDSETEQTIREMNRELGHQVVSRTRELEHALAQTTAVVDHLADGLLSVGSDGTIQTANPAFLTLMGTARDLVGQPVVEAISEELFLLVSACLDEGEVVRQEIVLGDGTRFGVVVASPILSARGSDGCVLLLRDITLEKQIDQMKSDFISTVSHELRTPLTSVLGFAKVTRSRLVERVFPHVPTDDKKGVRAMRQSRENLDIIVAEGQRLTVLINDLLDISKMEAGRIEWRMEACEPSEVLKRAIRSSSSLFTDPSVQLVDEVPGDLPTLVADADRIIQVVLNLLSNAAKFTQEGSVTVRARSDEKWVYFEVQDTGLGIAEQDLGSVFERFKQVGQVLTDKPQGTGLGLPICRQICRAHRGRISVGSVLGKGTTFSVKLPR